MRKLEIVVHTLHRCKRCGVLIESFRKRYCEDCGPIVAKEKDHERQRRFREKHGLDKIKQWVKEHPEERRLHARNYIHRHKEECRERLNDWRHRNPEKRSLQNKRAHARRRKRRLHAIGYRLKVTMPGKIVPCKDCGKDVVSQKGQRNYKKYCDDCIRRREIETRIRHNKKFKERCPDYDKNWRANRIEKIVAVTCIKCGCLVIYGGTGRLPHLCGYCRSIQRSKPYRWEPKDIETFIKIERRRVGLDDGRRWGKNEINRLFDFYYPPK